MTNTNATARPDLELVLTPLYAGVAAGASSTVDVLVRLQAPDAPAAKPGARPPQAVTLVIDRSGSMSGHPLAEALRCAHFVVERMRPVDSIGLVSFDDKVRRLWPPVPLGDGRAVHAAIDTIRSGGSTNLHGGWQDGAESLASVSGEGVRRVILLSDGQANVGLTDTSTITAQCAERAARGITTSTYGLGNGFNEELMIAMARAGGGNHYYGDSAEDLMEPFQQELELLGNLCLREVVIRVQPEPGVAVRMVSELRPVGGGWALPDLAWGSEAWAVMQLTVPEAMAREPKSVIRLASVSISGRELEAVTTTVVSGELKLRRLAPEAFAALPADELVARRIAELTAAAWLLRMRAAAAAGDWATVDRILAEAMREFGANPWLGAMLQTMQGIAASREQARILKEALYSSRRLNDRLAAKSESMAPDALASEATPAFLRRKRAQGKR